MLDVRDDLLQHLRDVVVVQLVDEVHAALSEFDERGIQFHALRTRQAGERAFVSMHVLVPGTWTIKQGHNTAEDVEASVRTRLPYATVFTHVEPIEDPRSFEDATLDRASPPSP